MKKRNKLNKNENNYLKNRISYKHDPENIKHKNMWKVRCH